MYPLLIIASLGLAAITVMTFVMGIGVMNIEDGVFASTLSAIVLLVGKAMTAMVSKKKDKKDKKDKTNVLIVLIVLSLFGGCARLVKGDKAWMNIKMGPPCKIELKVDGETVQKVEATQGCNITDVRLK